MWFVNAVRSIKRRELGQRAGVAVSKVGKGPLDQKGKLRNPHRFNKRGGCRFWIAAAFGFLLCASHAQDYTFTTLAGNSASGSADGTGSAARFNGPVGVAVDSAGNVYVADGGNHTIRRITPAGVVTTLAGLAGHMGSVDGTGGAARFNYPDGLAVDRLDNVYVADFGNGTIRRVTPAGAVTTVAGLAGSFFAIDGPSSAARFNSPRAVAVDESGNLYVADYYNQTIRKITTTGVVATLAGLAGYPGRVDGTGSAARFYRPIAVAVDSTGSLYVADSDNSTIRKVTSTGVVTTLAGVAGGWYATDGIGTAAGFAIPSGVAVDSSGNLYVSDYYNETIRKVTSAGMVTTLAGLAGKPGSTDGTGSAARFYWPVGIAVDTVGTVYVADSRNNSIRKGIPPGPELHLTLLGDQVIVTWPSSNAGFTLEATQMLGPSNWLPATPAPMTIGGQDIVTNLVDGSARFYRLRKE